MVAFSSYKSEKIPAWYPREFRMRSQMDKIIILGLVAIFIFSWTHYFSSHTPRLPSFRRQPHDAVYNDTLGFEKIFVLSLPGREDRLVPLLDAANATNLTMTTLSAVRDDQIAKEDLPQGWNLYDHALGVLGCMTSHIRTWELMVAQNISSAIVLESDADFDMRIHDSMPGLARGVRAIADWPFDEEHNKEDPLVQPYGDNWDVIWFGHCGSYARGNVRQYSYPDNSTQRAKYEFKISQSVSNDQHPAGTRAVYQLEGSVCTSGYAISLRGAQKYIKHFKNGDKPVDLAMSDFCTDEYDMTCLGVYPAIVAATGSASNIENAEDVDEWKSHQSDAGAKGPDRTGGSGIQISARVNAPWVLERNAGPYEWIYAYDGQWVSYPNGTRYQIPVNAPGVAMLQPEDRIIPGEP